MNQPIILANRSVISISGADKETFLQGLITNDINKVSIGEAIYAFMLSPQGRFLYDFFIAKQGENFLLDCCQERLAEIIQKLSFYKLRSKVSIKPEPNLQVAVCFDQPEYQANNSIIFPDPRHSQMGFRAFIEKNENQSLQDNTSYNFHRINLKIPDDSDLTFDKSFPLEFGFDDFNAIDYKKGCYVGQETTARMHYKGVIRKKIFLIKISNQQNVAKSSPVDFADKTIGEVLSQVFWQNQLLALALIKNLDYQGKEINFSQPQQNILSTSGNPIQIIK